MLYETQAGEAAAWELGCPHLLLQNPAARGFIP